MDHKKIKVLLIFGFVFAFIVFVSAPVFAFEGFDVECVPYWNDGTSVNDYFQFADPDIPDSAFYSPTGAQAKEIGLYTGFPVPYYADGDHYSVFMNFSIAVPAAALSNNWLGLYVKPQLSNPYMSTSSGGQFLIVNVGSYNPYGSSGNSNIYTGTFQWQGKIDCNYKILMSVFIDDGVSVGAQSWIYNFSCVFDLNLKGGSGLASDELRPFAVSAKYYLGYPTNDTAYYGLGLYKKFTCRCTDTSLYGLLENIESAVSSIDLSGLSGLSQLSTEITNIYNQVVHNGGVLESIYDDGEDDPDVTRWGEEASQFESVVSDYHNIESQMMGTVSDFTFPDAPNQTALNNVFNMFFGNELIFALILASLTVTIALLILF